jgi:hypothetical protein
MSIHVKVYREGRCVGEKDLDRIPWRDEAVALAVEVLDVLPDRLMEMVASAKQDVTMELRQDDGTRWEVKVGLKLVGEVTMVAEANYVLDV